MKIILFIRKKPLKLFNILLTLGLCTALVKPLANDWVSKNYPGNTSITNSTAGTRDAQNRQISVSGFSELGGFISALSGLLSAFKDAINPFVDAPVAGLEKAGGASKELAQSDLNYEAAVLTAEAGQKAQDLISGETSMACDVIRNTVEAADAKNKEGMLSRALTASHVRRGRYTTSSLGEMRNLLAGNLSDYCSPDSKERGLCSGEISPKNMPDGDIEAGTLLSIENEMASTMSREEYDAASKYVSWATDPTPAEMLPIVMEKTPAGQRYLLEARRRQAITSAAQYSLNRIIASRWEKK